MGLLDFLLGEDNSSNNGHDYDRSVFDTDRFRNNGSGNWVDWEDVSTGKYDGDGFEHPNFDEDGEWYLHTTIPYVRNHNLSSALHQRPGQNDWRQ